MASCQLRWNPSTFHQRSISTRTKSGLAFISSSKRLFSVFGQRGVGLLSCKKDLSKSCIFRLSPSLSPFSRTPYFLRTPTIKSSLCDQPSTFFNLRLISISSSFGIDRSLGDNDSDVDFVGKNQNQQQQQTHLNQHRSKKISPRIRGQKQIHLQGSNVRLIEESSAREVTQLFLHAHSSYFKNKQTQEKNLPWNDAASLQAAQQALEFWAHHTSNDRFFKGNRSGAGQRQRGIQHSSNIEENASMALELFKVLHDIHCDPFEPMTLDNAMYSHVIDALAKSPNLDHVILADQLIRQFISSYIAYHFENEKGQQHSCSNDTSKDGNDAFGVSQFEVQSFLQKLGLPLIPWFQTIEENDATSLSTSNLLKFPDSPILWDDSDHYHFPNNIRITGVMRGHSQQRRPVHADSLLQMMIKLSSPSDPPLGFSAGNNIFTPNDIGFATVIDAYSRVFDGPNAERILQLMKRQCFDVSITDDYVKKSKPSESGANVVAYNAAISAWARAAGKRMLRNEDAHSLSASNDMVTASRDAAERAEYLLREMWNQCRASQTEAQATSKQQCSPSKHFNFSELNDQRRSVFPDVLSYSSVISAYAKCLDQPYGMRRAVELLTELEGLAVQELNWLKKGQSADLVKQQTKANARRHRRGFQPNNIVYNTILQAHADSGDISAAEKILERMTSIRSSKGSQFPFVSPDTRTFNILLNACAKKGGAEAGFRAQAILRQMQENASNTAKESIRPDIVSYNTVLSAWSKSAAVCMPALSMQGEKSVSDPMSSIVGTEAAYKALELLKELEMNYLESSGRHKNSHRSTAIKPDIISYNTTISAFANASSYCKHGQQIAQEAESLIHRMKKSLVIEPDDQSFNGVILAWARSSGGILAARRAESILRSMKQPTIVSWSTVVSAYARADSAQNAELLLNEMENRVSTLLEQNEESLTHSQDHATIVPSIILYNTVLGAWAKSSDNHASRKAEALLERLEHGELYHLNVDVKSSDVTDDATKTAMATRPKIFKLPKPDVISYLSVLNALEYAADDDKAARSRSIFNRLKLSLERQHLVDLCGDCVKNEKVFNAGKNGDVTIKMHAALQKACNHVLAACVYTPAGANKNHRIDAARILVETLRDMNKFSCYHDQNIGSRRSITQKTRFNGPNQETYALFLQGCFHLFEQKSEERNLLAKLAIQECCKKGLLNSTIWRKFCTAVSEETIESFLLESDVDLEVIEKIRSHFQVNCLTNWDIAGLPEHWSRYSED